jgi:hypothetical protein
MNIAVKTYFPRLVRACHSGANDYHEHGGLTYKDRDVNVGNDDHGRRALETLSGDINYLFDFAALKTRTNVLFHAYAVCVRNKAHVCQPLKSPVLKGYLDFHRH